MYLKSIAIKGFKSFAKKTVLDFKPGVTMIVGPNGSGKSNVVDAAQWVLGEQSPSQLRGSTMEDVIFSGTQTSKPKSLCEVSLVLDNSDNKIPLDYSEICITRRMLKTGESDYFINGTACRLIDVFELLSDTGLGRNTHSIIAQGKIDEVIHCKAEERRHLIEEAAGVLKYKKRKDRSKRKLKSVDENLKRVNDVLKEVKRQSSPLKKHIEKAKTYKDLENRLKDLKVSKTVKKLLKHKERFEQIENSEEKDTQSKESLKFEIKSKQDELDNADKNLEMLQNKYAKENERYLRQISIRSNYEKTQILLNQKVESANEIFNSTKNKIESLAKQRDELSGKKEHLNKEKESIEKEINRSYERLKNIQNKASEIKLKWKNQNDKLLSSKNVIENIKNEIHSLKESKINLKTSLNMSSERIDLIKKDTENLEKEKLVINESRSKISSKIKEGSLRINKFDNESNELKIKKENLQKEISKNQEKKNYLSRNIENCRSKIEALENAFNYFEDDSEDIISFSEVKIEPGYEDVFNSIIKSFQRTSLIKDIKKDINLIEKDSTGRTFIDLSYSPEKNKSKSAFINKVKAPAKIKKVLNVIFDGIYVADDANEIDKEKTWVLKNGVTYSRGIVKKPETFDIRNEHKS